jgi:hypothetical protein
LKGRAASTRVDIYLYIQLSSRGQSGKVKQEMTPELVGANILTAPAVGATAENGIAKQRNRGAESARAAAASGVTSRSRTQAILSLDRATVSASG